MSADRDAFLRAICASPDDDTPRLVFADWLDDHGEPQRAEFIRVQCEMEQAEEFGPRWRELDKRQRKLLLANRAKWSAELANRGVMNAESRRGFVHEVTIYSKRFAAEAEKLLAAAPIRQVKFADLRAARGNVPLAELLRCPALARLQELDFANTLFLSNDEAELIAGCSALRGLRVLILPHHNLTPITMRALMQSANMNSVTQLELIAVSIEREWNGTDLAAALVADPGFRRITRLTLRGTGTGPAGIRAFAESPHAAGLKSLSISGGGVMDANRLGPIGAAALANSPNLANLTALGLAGQQLGLGGVRALAASPHLTGLRHLDLSQNKFTAAMLDALLASESLTNLISLELRWCDVPPDAVPKLREKFPHAAIVV
jgi:uncharacterized protein (TIGR02996 family)